MSCVIAARKGFLVDSGEIKIHKEKEYNIFEFARNINLATRFENYDKAIEGVVKAGEIIGCYAVFQKYHPGMTNRHAEMFFVANKYGFVYDTSKRRVYHDGGEVLNVVRTTQDSRLGTPFRTFQAAESFISHSLLSDDPYVILVPIFK